MNKVEKKRVPKDILLEMFGVDDLKIVLSDTSCNREIKKGAKISEIIKHLVDQYTVSDPPTLVFTKKLTIIYLMPQK